MATSIAFTSSEARVARVGRRGRGLVVAPLRRVSLPPAFWHGAEGAHVSRDDVRDLATRIAAGGSPRVTVNEIGTLYQLYLFPRTSRPNRDALVRVIVGSSAAAGGDGALVSDQTLLDGVSPHGPSDLVLVAAARREALARVQASLRRARIRTREFVPGTVGLYRFVVRFVPEALRGMVAVLAVEADAHAATLVLLSEGRLVAAREIRLPAGHDSTTEARETLERLAADLHESLDAVAQASKIAEAAVPTRVLLLGKPGPLGDVRATLEAHAFQGVEIVDAAARLREGGVRLDEPENALPEEPGEFAVPIGLALPFVKGAPDLRLAMPKMRRSVASSRFRANRTLVGASIAAAATVGLVALGETYSLSVQNDNADVLKSALQGGIRQESQLLGIAQGQKTLADELASLQLRASSRAVETRFQALLDRAPDSVKITSVALTSGEGELLPDVAVTAVVRGIVQGREDESETARTDVLRRYVEALEQACGKGSIEIREARPHKDIPNVETFEIHVAPGGRVRGKS
ncbi:MAG: hypothetical protein HYR85_27640 [Planctomycetes bacterium]|nr:hypothetical protein [Planctomycetota bacterium]MBI3844246.1 hypothetical protein [Planctomycetota bacterium]